MENQAFNALCRQETRTFDGRKVLLSELIYEIEPILSDKGKVGYSVSLDGKYLGVIKDEQFESHFIRTTLTLGEYREIDHNSGVIVWC